MKNITKQLPQRRSIRIPKYDYRQLGSYFVTICTFEHRCFFGKIVDEKIQLSKIGAIIKACWEQIPLHFNHVNLNQFVVMPNHLHGIVEFTNYKHSNQYESGRVLPNSISSVVRSFKANATRIARVKTNNARLKIWQRNFYEHVIRNEKSGAAIQEYIINNPLKWELDSLHPTNQNRAQIIAPLLYLES